MATDGDLKKLFLHSVGSNRRAVMTALDEQMITLDDIDEKNDVQKRTVFEWAADGKGGTVLPDRFILLGTVQELGRLAGPHSPGPNQARATTELIRRAKGGDNDALLHFVRYRQNSTRTVRLPEEVQSHFKSYFADPTQFTDGLWASVRECLNPALEQEIVQLRAAFKRKATVAKGGPAVKKPADPLLAALQENDSSRLSGLDLETLKPERWEKAKEIWLAASVPLKAHLVRLPWALVKDHASVALTASAEADHKVYGDRTAAPSWVIPKDVLKTLSTKVLCHWLKSAAMHNGYKSKASAVIRPRIGFKELVEEWGPLIMGEALQGDDIGLLFEWSKHLEKHRRLIHRLASQTAPIGGLKMEETKMLTVVLSSIEDTVRPDEFLPRAIGEAAGFMDLFNWLLMRSESDQLRFGKVLLEDKIFRSVSCKVFGNEAYAPVNFYLEGIEDPVKEPGEGLVA